MKKTWIILLITLIMSCSADDGNEVIDNSSNSPMTFTFNGENRTPLDGAAAATNTQITLGESTISSFGISGGFADLSGNLWSLGMSFTSSNGAVFTEGAVFSSTNLSEGESFLAIYSQNLEGDEDLFDAENNGDLFFTLSITEIDLENQTVSGEFSLNLNAVGSDEIFEIRNGQYTNLPLQTN